MQTGSVTTPFGQRSATLALVRRQMATADIKQGKTVQKWKVFRDISAAIDQLGIQPTSVAVLDALLSFYPDNELRQDAKLIVFPSNRQLALRAHGISEAALRRHVAILVESGLIFRKDSANGKRYARKNNAGEIESAFGFDLSPLLARSEELALMAQQVMADRAIFRTARENLTICRRDVRKLISAAMDEGADGDWQSIEEIYVRLVGTIPRAPSLSAVQACLEEMDMLREEIINRLEMQVNSPDISGNAAQDERHIQNSQPKSFNELEPGSKKEQETKSSEIVRLKPDAVKTFPLGLVMKACPTIADYGPGGGIGSWRDLMLAAVVVRSTLGVSPSAYQDACDIMGPENAAIAIAGILERANMINSAGAYLRDLTRRTERGEFSLGPMIMALLKANGQAGLKAG